MENAKVYVDVLVNFDKDGTMSGGLYLGRWGKISCGPYSCKGALC